MKYAGKKVFVCRRPVPCVFMEDDRKCQSKHMVDRLNPRPASLCRRLTSKFSGAQSSFLRPGGITAGLPVTRAEFAGEIRARQKVTLIAGIGYPPYPKNAGIAVSAPHKHWRKRSLFVARRTHQGDILSECYSRDGAVRGDCVCSGDSGNHAVMG